MKKRSMMKTVAVFLAFLMIFYLVPTTVYADLFDFEKSSEAEEPGSENNGDIFEITERREESVKHFRLEDGTVTAVQYDAPVHYLDSSGKWQDIDNTLAASGGEYVNGNARIKFAKKVTGNGSLFTLHDGNRKITMSLEGAIKKTAGQVTNPTTDWDENTPKLQKMMTLDKLSSRILYEDILDGVDLEYVIESLNIKENIIVKEKKNEYRYTFTMDLNHLEAVLNPDGSVSISDPSSMETVYTIPAPIAYDANGAYAAQESLHFILTQTGNHTYSLTVVADPDWMNAPERAFPVVIDPAIYANRTTITDTYVDEGVPTRTNGTNDFVATGHGSGGEEYVAYIKFSLPSIPADAYISSAKVDFFQRNYIDYEDKGYANFGAYHVITNWDNSHTWNAYLNGTQGMLGDLISYVQADDLTQGMRLTWDITSLAREWYAGTSLNYGIAIKQIGEEYNYLLYLGSSDFASEKPRILIHYKDMNGVESYWSYSSHAAGLAGTGYINHATGALTLVKSLLSTTDSLFPFTPSIVYQSALAAKTYEYPNAQTCDVGWSMPFGFKMNIQETLIKKGYLDIDGNNMFYYIWADSDGTEHYFTRKEGSTVDYEDEDGLQLTLHEGTDEATIVDDSKIERIFSKSSSMMGSDVYERWYLTGISDPNNNVVSFEYNQQTKELHVCLKPNGSTKIDFLTIGFESSDLPYAIWNATTREAIIFRYSSTYAGSITTSSPKYLRELVYVHSASAISASSLKNYYETGVDANLTVDGKASYTYNSSGRLTKAKDELSGYEIRYSYSGSKVTAIQEYANSSTAGQKIGFTYNTNYTEVRNSGSDDVYGNSDDLITRYTFDNEGRAVGAYTTDTTKSQIYGASSVVYEEDQRIRNYIDTSTAVGSSPTNFLLNGGFEDISSNGNAEHWTKSSSNIRYLSSLDGSGGEREAWFEVKPGVTDYIYQYTQLPAGTYTLSMRINTYNCENAQVYIIAESLNNSSNVFTEEVPVNEYYASGSMSFFNTSFTAGSYNGNNSENFKITIKIVGGNVSTSEEVSVSVDNIMLEENIGNSEYSLVQYGNFEKFAINASGTDQNNMKNYWINDSNGMTCIIAEDPFHYAGYLSGSITTQKNIKQTIYEAPSYALSAYDSGDPYASAATTYTISGFAKGTGQVPSEEGAFRLRVEVSYYNGAGNEDTVVPYYYDFQVNCKDWQFVCGTFQTEEYKLVRSIVVYCDYWYQPGGYAMFDNIAVVQSTDDSVVRYRYYTDDPNAGVEYSETLDGLVHVMQSGYYTEVYEYNDDRQIVRIANNRGELYDYTYKSNGVDVATVIYYHFTSTGGKNYPYLAEDPDAMLTKTPKTKTTNSYNNYGQLTTSNTYEAYASGSTVGTYSDNRIYSYNQYNTTAGSRIFGALLSSTDSLNRTTRYYYDSANGRLLALVNVNEGNGTCYTYDAVGNLTSAMPATYVSSSSYTADVNGESVSYEYNDANLLESISTESTTYDFTYDSFGNADSVSVGERELAGYEYNSNNGKLTDIHYGNDFSVRYVYDHLDNLKEAWYTDGTDDEVKAYEYTYTVQGQLYRFDNLLTGKSTVYKYDTSGKLTNFIEFDADEMVNDFGANIYYNDQGRVSSLFYHMDYSPNSADTAQLTHYYYSAYNPDGSINYYSVDTDVTDGDIDYSYDAHSRVTTKVYDFYRKSNSATRFTNTVTYGYSSYLTRTSGQVESVSSKVNSGSPMTYFYTYDDNGNITSITQNNGATYRYAYDDLGQLIREDNSVANRTYVYTYDDAGNILTKKEYALTAANATPTTLYSTVTYGYNDADWGDLLTSYGGDSITYDEIGNPIKIENPDNYGNEIFMEWDGRELAKYYVSSIVPYNICTYTYNDEGIRTSKTVDGVTHYYYLSGSQIIAEEWNNILCLYLYDADGSPIGMQYRTKSMAEGSFYTYWFEKNLQGDIVAVYNDSGVKLRTYTYDAWGNVTETVLSQSGTNYYARYNPFRYRGYYYDTETGLYYLQSRYYNPEWGRFLNADGYVNANGDIVGFNMFAYCSNNPVMGYDPTGEWNWGKFWDGVVSIGAAVVGVVSGVIAGGSILVTTGNVGVAVAGGIVAGSAATGAINNTVNAIYYEFSDGESDLTSDSYVENGYLTRWERLDYAKNQTEESHYNLNAWRYYSEYGLHMYGWLATGWALDKDVSVVSNIAKSCQDADVEINSWDKRIEVNIGTIIIGILGY